MSGDIGGPVSANLGTDFRESVREFLRANLPPNWRGLGALGAAEAGSFLDGWRRRLAEHRLLAPSWPEQFGGGGLSQAENVVVVEEFCRAAAPQGTPNDVFSIKLVGNIILQLGRPDQKKHFLPRIISGEDVWCQGYSEPNAGSDLANVGVRAVLERGGWVLNGQKVWTSRAHLANWIFVLARSEPDVAKHAGITFLLVPMDQPGIEIRPIRQMSGNSEFYETYFSDARTPAENIIGEPGGGWRVATALLGYERGESAATLPIELRVEFDRLVELVRERGVAGDPVVRQRLAIAYSKVEVLRYLGERALTGLLAGLPPGPEASITKLFWSEYHREVTEMALDVLGAEALVHGELPIGRQGIVSHAGSPNDTESWLATFFYARAGTIYQGTSEIQRNILGEKVLGLPKEPGDRSGTWAELQRKGASEARRAPDGP